MASQIPWFKKNFLFSDICGSWYKSTVKDSHILQTMTVYAATDNKLMYVCVCMVFIRFFKREHFTWELF